MALVRMDIQTLVVSNGPLSSLVVLKSRTAKDGIPLQLPIRIGAIEAAAISMGVTDEHRDRPTTHDLLKDMISALGASLTSVAIVDVRGTTFYARLNLLTREGSQVELDCRPSDAIALAARLGAPMLAEESVLETASVPDFGGVEQEERAAELERFHDFVETLSPEDFA